MSTLNFLNLENLKQNKMKAKICCNCKHSGVQFKLSKVTHCHCEHPKYDERGKAGELSAWDTLYKFSETCEDFEFKQFKIK